MAQTRTGLKRRRPTWLQRLQDPSVGLPTVFVASLLEATAVPIPIELALVPLMVKARKRLWALATAALLGALGGALIGYAVGFFVFDLVGRPFLEAIDAMGAFNEVRGRLEDYGFVVVFTIGVTAVPFQVATVGAGVTGLHFAVFAAATLLARGLRYYGLALLVALFGARIEAALRSRRRAAWILTTLLLLALLSLVASSSANGI